MRSLEIDAGCFGCSYLKFNGIVKMPSEDGYDCMKCNIRVIDFFMIKNGSSEEAMKKMYPPYGVPEFCPISKDFIVEGKEEMEFI